MNRHESRHLPTRELVMIIGLGSLALSKRRLQRENARLRHEVTHDDLTGLLTKRAFLAKVNRRLENAQPHQVHALLLGDVDSFKAINDKHPGGHAEGDQVLATIGATLKQHTRHQDQADDLLAWGRGDDVHSSRLGGDEFAVFAELTTRDPSVASLSPEQRLGTFVARLSSDLSLPFEGRQDLKELGFGISISGTLYQPGDTANSMLERAEQELRPVKVAHHRVQGTYRS